MYDFLKIFLQNSEKHDICRKKQQVIRKKLILSSYKNTANLLFDGKHFYKSPKQHLTLHTHSFTIYIFIWTVPQVNNFIIELSYKSESSLL